MVVCVSESECPNPLSPKSLGIRVIRILLLVLKDNLVRDKFQKKNSKHMISIIEL